MLLDVLCVMLMEVFAFLVFLLIKNENTYKNQEKILNAIRDYVIETKDYDKCYYLIDNMESYKHTLWRLWDFGYENILPKADYELIKPYIKKGK